MKRRDGRDGARVGGFGTIITTGTGAGRGSSSGRGGRGGRTSRTTLTQSLVTDSAGGAIWSFAGLDFSPHDANLFAVLVSLLPDKLGLVIASSDIRDDLGARLEEGIVEDGHRRRVGSRGHLLGVSSVSCVTRAVLGRSSGDGCQKWQGKEDLGQHLALVCRSFVE